MRWWLVMSSFVIYLLDSVKSTIILAELRAIINAINTCTVTNNGDCIVTISTIIAMTFKSNVIFKSGLSIIIKEKWFIV